MTGRTSVRILLLATAPLLALPAAAVAQDDEPMLCAALDIAAVAQDTGLEFESMPGHDSAGLCQVFVVGETHHGAFLQFHEAPFEQTRESRDAVEFALGERSAFSNTYDNGQGRLVTEVYVDFAPEVLQAQIWAPEDAVAGQLDHTIAMTERVVAAIDELGLAPELPSASTAAAEAAGIVVPAIDGVQFYGEREVPEFVEALAAAIDVDPSAVTVINLEARSCPTCPHLGAIAAIRVVGSDEGALTEAVTGVMAASAPMEATESEIGGKVVTVFADESGGQLASLYVIGDTAYLIAIGEPHDAAMLEALP